MTSAKIYAGGIRRCMKNIDNTLIKGTLHFGTNIAKNNTVLKNT